MNTDVQVIVIVEARAALAAAAALADVEALFVQVEATLSRFRHDSELVMLNNAGGEPFQPSKLLSTVLEYGLSAARETQGLFDPTILGALVDAGYDRSFELRAESGNRSSVAPRGSTTCNWREVEVDPRTGLVRLPLGCGVDLGGIGKGWSVDQAVQLLHEFEDFAIDAGGDIYAAGRQADSQPWTVGVEDPFARGRDLLTLMVRDRAVATSSVARRRWCRSGRVAHHLIDPRSGTPAETGVAQATVVAHSVARAEILSKVALILGSEDGLRFLNEQHDAEGLLVMDDGRVTLTAGLKEIQHVA